MNYTKVTKPSSAKQAATLNRHLKSSEYTDRRLTFGRHVNTRISDLPQNYLIWGSQNLKGDWQQWFQKELLRRERTGKTN